MKNQITVRELICEMNNITRMRKEIGLVVNGLRGRLRKSLFDECEMSVTDILVFRGDSVEWKFWIGRNGWLIVECVINCQSPDRRLAYTNKWIERTENDIAMEDVEIVYDSLQVLVDGLFNRFISLNDEAESIRRIASKFS